MSGNLNIDGQLIFIGLLVFFGLLLLFMGVHKVDDGNARIVERLGKRHKTLLPGINVIVPFLDSVKKSGIHLTALRQNNEYKLYKNNGDISLAEHQMDPPSMKLIASDNTRVNVDAVAYFKISEPMKAVYDVSYFANTFTSLIETTLRQEVARFDGDTIVSSRESLSENLRIVLQEASTNWGVIILRVEIEDIAFDKDVEKRLSDAREQELIRRSDIVASQSKADQQILEAEAFKKAEILKAEGMRQASILKAEGDKESQILAAQGQFEEEKLQAEAKFLMASREQEGVAKGYNAIIESLGTNTEAIIALESIKAQEKVAESLGNSNNTMILPAEAAGLFGAFGAAAKGVAMLAGGSDKQ